MTLSRIKYGEGRDSMSNEIKVACRDVSLSLDRRGEGVGGEGNGGGGREGREGK